MILLKLLNDFNRFLKKIYLKKNNKRITITV